MKIFKYLVSALAITLVISCSKHEILYDTTPVDDHTAEFQLHYFEPINNEAKYYIDSVYINNMLYSSVLGSGQLLPYNGVPGGATGRFFSVKAGEVNIKFYRKGVIVYDKNTTLEAKKQNIFVHSLNQAPVVLDNEYPYSKDVPLGTAANWDTDSIALVKFYNFLYEKEEVPYSGKLQYQFQDVRSKEWKNLGKPVGFGEATDRVIVKVVKTIHNSSGSCRIDYRILDEKGTILQVMNGSGKIINYSDWWTTYIGRAYMHIFKGLRTQKPISSVVVWTSL